MSFIYDAPIEYDSPQPYDFQGAWSSIPTIVVVLPHLSAAMSLQGDGTFNWWQQGTIDEVAQSVEMIVGTTKGQRTVVPGFGIDQLPFSAPANIAAIQAAINLWEPRANATVGVSGGAPGEENITVNTSLRRGSTS